MPHSDNEESTANTSRKANGSSRGALRHKNGSGHNDGGRHEHLQKDFLHRCCIQFSPLFTAKQIQSELELQKEFISRWSQQYSPELARAMVWRVVESEGEEDLLGAWSLIASVYDLALKEQVVEAHLLSSLEQHLQRLVRAKWFTTRVSQSIAPLDGGLDPLEELKQKLGISSTVIAASSSAVTKYVSTASSNSQDKSGTAAGYVVNEAVQHAYSNTFHALADKWLSRLHRDLATMIRKAMAETAERGNVVDAKTAHCLMDIPRDFRDSLAKLRRKHPRPSNIIDILRAYGWKPEARVDIDVRPDGLPSVSDLEDPDLRPMHPVAKGWIEMLARTKKCLKCDSWKHDGKHCPCVHGVRKLTPINPPRDLDRKLRPKPPMTYTEAVSKLARYDLTLPLEDEKVLDTVVTLIQREIPYDELLEAFDTVRGSITGVEERHALWIHASYNLLPSKTVFAQPMPGAHGQTPSMVKAQQHMERLHRFHDFDYLQSSVEILKAIFVEKTLPSRIRKIVDDFSQYRRTFVFCLFDGTIDTSIFPIADCSPLPDELMEMKPYLTCMCKNCLQPFHNAETCPNSKQPWDYKIAQEILDEYGLVNLRDEDGGQSKVEAARDRIGAEFGDNEAKANYIRNTLDIASLLIIQPKVRYCRVCKVYGHGVARCEINARETLKRDMNMHEMELMLDQEPLLKAIEKQQAEVDRIQGELDALLNNMAEFDEKEALYRKEISDRDLDIIEIKENIARHDDEVVELLSKQNDSTLDAEAFEKIKEELKRRRMDKDDDEDELDRKERNRRAAADDLHKVQQDRSDAQQKMKDLEFKKTKETRAKSRLEDVKGTFCNPHKVCPPKFKDAIRELTAAGVEVQAARYSPDAFSQFLVYTQRTYLEDAAQVCQEPKFPDLCLYCGSLKHKSYDCNRIGSPEAGAFLRELEASGVSLATFSVAILCPERSASSSTYRNKNGRTRLIAGAALLPTRHPEGRLSVIRTLRDYYIDDYASGGVMRRKWDRLQHAIEALQTSNIELALAKFNPTVAKRFVEGTDRPHLASCIEDVFQAKGIQICLFCSSLTHDSLECRSSGCTLDDLDVLREMIHKGHTIASFATNVLCSERLPSNELFDVRNAVPAALDRSLDDLTDKLKRWYDRDYGASGRKYDDWRRDQDEAATLTGISSSSTSSMLLTQQMGGRTRSLFGGEFSQQVSIPTTIHQLVPDPLARDSQEEDNENKKKKRTRDDGAAESDDESARSKGSRREHDSPDGASRSQDSFDQQRPYDDDDAHDHQKNELPTVNAEDIDFSDLLSGTHHDNEEQA